MRGSALSWRPQEVVRMEQQANVNFYFRDNDEGPTVTSDGFSEPGG